MPVTLVLKTPPPVPLEAELLTPDTIAERSRADICALPVNLGKRRKRLDDFFDVEGERSDEIEIRGDASRVKWIGRGMTRGRMLIRGNGGMHLGSGMTGGAITVTGNAKLIDGCDANGQIIPFAATKAERGADPRPSLQERYGNPDGTNANYVAAVKAAADKLVKDRFLLELPGAAEDVETYTTPAASVAIPANP